MGRAIVARYARTSVWLSDIMEWEPVRIFLNNRFAGIGGAVFNNGDIEIGKLLS